MIVKHKDIDSGECEIKDAGHFRTHMLPPPPDFKVVRWGALGLCGRVRKMTPGVQAPKARRVNIEMKGTGERVVLSHRSLPGVFFLALTGSPK